MKTFEILKLKNIKPLNQKIVKHFFQEKFTIINNEYISALVFNETECLVRDKILSFGFMGEFEKIFLKIDNQILNSNENNKKNIFN